MTGASAGASVKRGHVRLVCLPARLFPGSQWRVMDSFFKAPLVHSGVRFFLLLRHRFGLRMAIGWLGRSEQMLNFTLLCTQHKTSFVSWQFMRCCVPRWPPDFIGPSLGMPIYNRTTEHLDFSCSRHGSYKFEWKVVFVLIRSSDKYYVLGI